MDLKEKTAPDAETRPAARAPGRSADKTEILAGYVATGEREPCGLSVEWLMDQLTGRGDRS